MLLTEVKVKFMGKSDSEALLQNLFEPEDLYERFGGTRKEVPTAGSEFDSVRICCAAFWMTVCSPIV